MITGTNCNWTKTAACMSGRHCVACRSSGAWRESVVRAGLADTADFACPRGLPLGWHPPWWSRLLDYWRHVWRGQSRGLGDTVAKVTKTVGIRPCGGCQKRREWLNHAVPYQRTVERA